VDWSGANSTILILAPAELKEDLHLYGNCGLNFRILGVAILTAFRNAGKYGLNVR
jgi:hypothetical protein